VFGWRDAELHTDELSPAHAKRPHLSSDKKKKKGVALSSRAAEAP